MHKFKKYAALLIAFCMTVGTAAFAVACKDDVTESSSNSTTESTSGETSADSSEESSSSTKEKFLLSITVEKEDGSKVEGIQFRLQKGSKRFNVTTDAEGKASIELDSGSYKLSYVGEIPLYHEWKEEFPEVELSENRDYTFVLVDKSPNGTEERPFSLIINADGTMEEQVIPANTTYYYTLYKTTADKLIVENENVVITKGTSTYSPENGTVTMPIDLEGTHDNILFTLTNTSNEEITVAGYTTIDAVEGSVAKPFALILDTAITANKLAEGVEENDVVYYTWTATASGTLTVSADTDTDTITLKNNTTSIVSNDWRLQVNEGDVIHVVVSLKEVKSITFTAHFE